MSSVVTGAAGGPDRGAGTRGRRDPQVAIGLLVVVSMLLRLVWIDRPARAAIGDEPYYVGAARVILGIHDGHYGGAPAGLDPNQEHPPLGKLLIALSMRVFGDNGLGWRLPSVLAGTASIVLVYLIARRLGGGGWGAFTAAAIFSLDSLGFVAGRMATLDSQLLVFGLLGAWLYLRGWRALAGVSFGLAALVKLNGVAGLAAMVLIEIVVWWRASWGAEGARLVVMRRAGALVGGFVPTLLLGLLVFDLRFSSFRSPFEHLQHMLSYGSSLKTTGGSIPGQSYPWQWPLGQGQYDYYLERGPRVLVQFRAAINPVLLVAAAVAVVFGAWRAWRARDLACTWALFWVGANYLPFVVLAGALHRVTYVFYFLPVIPALAVLVSNLVLWRRLARAAAAAFLVLMLVGFAMQFPFRPG